LLLLLLLLRPLTLPLVEAESGRAGAGAAAEAEASTPASFSPAEMLSSRSSSVCELPLYGPLLLLLQPAV